MRYLCAIIATTLLAGSAFADTIYVPGDHATIQGAIDASNNGDVIEIAAGTYFEHDINPGGRAITISGATNADGTPAVTIDAQRNGRGVVCNAGETPDTVLLNLVVTGGSICYEYTANGLGMLIHDSSPTVTNCIFIDNTNIECEESEYIDVYGGAVHIRNGSPLLASCIFVQNDADGGAGAYVASGICTFEDCTFMDNTASWVGGGGININGEATLINCSISGNTASQGGGVHLDAGANASIHNTVIENNSAYSGGGIFCNGSLSLNGSIITNNSADYGGGIKGSYGGSSGGIFELNTASYGAGAHGGDTVGSCGNFTIANAIIKNNIALFNGGGVYSACTQENATAVISCTICGNEPNQVWQINADEETLAQIQEECTSDVGACCTGNSEICVETNESDCNFFGGTFIGYGVACSEVECPNQCLGDVTGDGQVNVEDLLTVIANWNSCP